MKRKDKAMPKKPDARDATQSLLMLLREAHEMLDLIGVLARRNREDQGGSREPAGAHR